MKLHYLVLFVIVQTQAIDIKVDGEVFFKMKLRNTKNNEVGPAGDESHVKINKQNPRSQVTAGSMVECVYQYPEDNQVLAILSTILNQLTKVFVRAESIMKEESRRRGDTRFRVITKKNTGFFDRIYSNMIGEYLSQYNSSTDRVVRSGQQVDPCINQKKIKQIWKDLLDNTISTFRRAASDCIEEHLKLVNRSSDDKLRGKLTHLLMGEVNKVRKKELNMLCDTFQLCYNELL